MNFLKSTAFLAIIACILWSTAFTGIKIGLHYTPPLQFAGLRFFLAGLLLIPFVKQLPLKLRIARAHWKLIALVGLLQITIEYGLFYTGLNMVSGALGAMIVGSGPVFVTLVAHFSMQNDRLSTRKIISIFLGLVGVVIITLGQKELSTEGNFILIGILLLILNNIISGMGNVLVSKSASTIPPLILSSFSMIFGGATLFLFALPIEGFNPKPVPLEYWMALGWLSLLSATAITIWYTLLNRPGVKVSNLNMWKFIIPVVGALLSWTILPGESANIASVVGMLVIAASILVLTINTKGSKG